MSALYETEVTLNAPTKDGVYIWTVIFTAGETVTQHRDASTTFSFRTTQPPEHRVIVKINEKDTEESIQNVQVQLGVYRTSTDEQGHASLEVPKGRFDLELWKVGYKPHLEAVEITENLTIGVTLARIHKAGADDEQVWM